MAQISKGKTFVTGEQVTATNLNKIVDDATLQPGAITAQAAVTSVATTNLILTTPSTGSTLNRVSLADVATSLSLAKTNAAQSFTGNLTMSGGADIALTSGSILSLPAGATQTLANGSSLTLSSGAILTLGQDPITLLQAATKKYVDNNFLPQTDGVNYTYPLAFNGGYVSISGVTQLNDIQVDNQSRLLLSNLTPSLNNEAVPREYLFSAINSKMSFTRTPSTGTFEQGSLQIGDTVIKFGSIPASGNVELTVVFELSFPNEILAAFTTTQKTSGATDTYAPIVIGTGKTSKSQIVVDPTGNANVYWLAIGR